VLGALPTAELRSPPVAVPVQPRLGWLDGLRGIAALLVVHGHLTAFLMFWLYEATTGWIYVGPAGVYLFFLISGYVIPASLEHGGDLRRFWVRRAARLYPLYLVAVGAFVATGLWAHIPYYLEHRGATALAHLTMMQVLIGVPDLLFVTWTLAYEMAFYLLCAALYAIGQHRRSSTYAIGLALAATVLTAPVLRLTDSPLAVRNLIVGTVAVLAIAVVAQLSGHRRVALAGAVLGGLLALVLLANGDPGQLLLPATMFIGTAIYRVHQGQIGWRWAGAAVLAVTAGWLVYAWRMAHPHPATTAGPHSLVRWLATIAFVALLFAGGLALRHRRIPAIVVWFGLISYSLYLLHPIVVFGAQRLIPRLAALPRLEQVAIHVALMAIVVGMSATTYRLVELPAQRLGRWVAARWRAPVGRRLADQPAGSPG